MEVDLTASDWDTERNENELREQDIHIKRLDIEDETELMKLIKSEWELWEYELQMSVKSDPPAVYVAKTSNGIKAFSAWDGNNKGTGWFGPMGTHPDLRGKGVGSVLLFRCLQDMKMRGYESSTIPWVGPVSFYSHFAGARISRVFWRYEKKLTKKL
jgi:GNAT superfamily N-acetyltransferase